MPTIKQYNSHPGGRAAAWIFLCLLPIILISCSPYVDLPAVTPTITARPTVTGSQLRTPTAIQPPTPFPTCTVRTGMPAGTVNLRAGAGVSHAVVRVLSEGEILRVIERAPWLKVMDARGDQGFINSKFCR